MGELLTLCKQCLSIVSTATAKDAEITMLIGAAKQDLARQGIVIAEETEQGETINDLVKSAIAMFVKANFGMVDIKEKELAQKTYILLCKNLGLSSDYLEVESND